MATANMAPSGEPQELSGVVVGWQHRNFAQNIHLTVQSSSKSRPMPGSVDMHHLLMTRSQAFLLARYLMQLSGIEAPMPRRKGFFARWFG
ncbi:MAG: hypothetical protein V4521_07450 [Pseudomonadota bacterium]